MTDLCCPNCGLQIDPESNSLGETPLEEVVATNDDIRLAQLAAAGAGKEYRHSVSIAANFPACYGGSDEG